MAHARRSAAWLALLVAVSLFVPAGASAAPPHRGTLGTGLPEVAAGHAPGRAILQHARGGVREIGISVQLAAPPDGAARGRLAAAGMDLRGAWHTSIEGYVRPRDLAGLAATPGVVAVRALRAPLPSAFVGPGPTLQGAAPWQLAGYTGAGVKIGVLDVGFDGLPVRLGVEAPATVEALCFTDVGISSSDLAGCATAGDTHGTAVVESIVDMAPGAQLFVSNAWSQADKAAAITWMTGHGVRIVNYSQVGALLLQGMGDGTSEYADSDYTLVDAAVAGGALFVASAGNSGESAWAGAPTDANGNGWIEFAGADESNAVTLGSGEVIAVALRWPSAASDYDLLLYDGDTVVASSEDAQAATGDPYEFFVFQAPHAGAYDLAVWHAAGPEAGAMRLLIHAPGPATLAHVTVADSLPTPADARNPGMVTVGAVDYRTPTAIEPYSSQGPTYDGRVKPDLVAADCAPTTIEAEFCGTSQAAPFVSGAAALLLEADPALTPTTLAARLRERAVPLGSPVPNSTFGHGRLSLGTVPAEAPTAAAFVAPPASGTAAAPLLGQPAVTVVDANGRTIVAGPGATLPVTLALATNPTGAALTCAGGLTRAAVAGVASFDGCSIDRAGSGYVLRAEVPGLAAATSAPFTVGAPGDPPQVSLAIAPPTVVFGRSVAGTLGAADPGAANAPAVLEWSRDGRTWATVADVALDGSGAARPTAAPTVHGRYRARVSLADGSVAVSASVSVRVNAAATLASSVPSGRTITRRTRIALTETIRPFGAGVARGRARFDLYQLVGSTWVRRRTIYAAASTTTGRARVTTTLPAGRWWIRSRAEYTTTNGSSAWTSGVRYRVP